MLSAGAALIGILLGAAGAAVVLHAWSRSRVRAASSEREAHSPAIRSASAATRRSIDRRTRSRYPTASASVRPTALLRGFQQHTEFRW